MFTVWFYSSRFLKAKMNDRNRLKVIKKWKIFFHIQSFTVVIKFHTHPTVMTSPEFLSVTKLLAMVINTDWII